MTERRYDVVVVGSGGGAMTGAASVFGSVYPGPGAPLGSAMVFAALAVRDIVGS